jgi:hypothetical protein
MTAFFDRLILCCILIVPIGLNGCAKDRDHHLVDLLNQQRLLRQELDARDKKIKDMSRQLKVLKQIDLEMSEKCYPPKPIKKPPLLPDRISD